MEQFINNFCQYYGIPSCDVIQLLSHAPCKHYRKGETVIPYGGFDDSFYILKEGIWRSFKSEESQNQTLWFALGGEIVIDIFCYQKRERSCIGIESETDSIAYVIGKSEVEHLCATSLQLANLFRHIFEKHACEFEENILALFNCQNSTERYLSLLKRHPELLQQIPLKKLSSYLMITPQSLSRIRANMKW